MEGHQQAISLFPESIQGASRHCLAELCPEMQENKEMETDTMATDILPFGPPLPGAGNSQPNWGQQADEKVTLLAGPLDRQGVSKKGTTA